MKEIKKLTICENINVGFAETCPKTKLDIKSNSFFSPKVELKTPFTPKTKVLR